MRHHIRIESHENVVRDAKVYYIKEDGEEVDISRCVTGVDLHLHVGDAASASLHVLFVENDVTAEVRELFFREPKRRWRDRLRRRSVRSMTEKKVVFE